VDGDGGAHTGQIEAHQQAANAALAAKRGDQKVSDLKGPARSIYESMSGNSRNSPRASHGQKAARVQERSDGRSAGPNPATALAPSLALRIVPG
jgi:hypothetical protein